MQPLIAQVRARALDTAKRTDTAAAAHASVLTPASSEQIAATERRLGHRLPPVLAEAYAMIGNGGWGPGYGLLGLEGGVEGDPGDGTSIDLYEVFRGEDPEDPAWHWPEGLLPICDWGCAIRTCVDCTTPDGPVWTFDPNVDREPGDPMERYFAQTHASVAGWFEDWVNGVKLWDVMFTTESSVTGINPFTKEPIVISRPVLRPNRA
jgi:hypothetical protein